MYFNIAKITDKGGRPHNQDYADFAIEGNFVCVAVADGLGAYEGSEIAGETAVKSVLRGFIKAVRKEEEIFSGSTMNRLFKHAHNAIHKRKNELAEMRNGCTTLSVAITDGKNLIAAHAGDTRIYFFKSNSLEFYSKDHSLARLAAERGEIEYSAIRTHKDQNKLTRVLGSDYFIQPDFKIYRDCSAEDSLIVCTDGFWEYVYERDMEKVLSTCADSESALDCLVGLILSRAPKGSDNYSAVLLRFTDTEPLDEAERKDLTETENNEGLIGNLIQNDGGEETEEQNDGDEETEVQNDGGEETEVQNANSEDAASDTENAKNDADDSADKEENRLTPDDSAPVSKNAETESAEATASSCTDAPENDGDEKLD